MKTHSCPNHCDERMIFDDKKGCWRCPSCNLLAVFNTLVFPYTENTLDLEEHYGKA